MSKLLKYVTIDKIEYVCWFAGYDVNCKERYEYATASGHSYFVREKAKSCNIITDECE